MATSQTEQGPLERLPWQDVASSNVRRVAWVHSAADDAANRLDGDPYGLGCVWVEFRNGGVYYYDDVPRYVYIGLLGAASVGAYVARRLRHKYPTTKVGEHPLFQHG